MKRSILFYKELTSAEVGQTRTHEVYVRLPNYFDYESFFGGKASVNGSVIDTLFTVTNITPGHLFDASKTLRFVYYFNNTNKEKRIPSLSSLFQENDVSAGDYFFLEKLEGSNNEQYRICFMKPESIVSNPVSTYYSKNLEGNQFVNVISDTSFVKKEYSPDDMRDILMKYFEIQRSNSEPTNLKTVGHTFGMEFGKQLSDVRIINSIVDEIVNPPLELGYLKEAIKFGVALYHTTELELFGLKFWEPDSIQKNIEFSSLQDKALQEIYYGAPGTGKSHEVKLITSPWEIKDRVVRTTFHPDSDYSTFVGAYKPTMVNVPVRNNLGQLWTKTGKLIAANEEYKIDEVVTEKQISYKFVSQAFLNAYVNAWINRDEPEFLIIEEINRGNCAQIFGDLFQLLDRADSGYSDYAIQTDKDLQNFLADKFDKANIPDFPKVKSGEQMLLPPNLYIWATMNTSDQSLFPIDSAFKRRWRWNYVKIANAYQKNADGSYKRDESNKRIPLGWQIKVDQNVCDWWEFLMAINEKIASTTVSDDKKLGYFFCKPVQNTIYIDEDTFVGKVIFYLWNDVFKDNDTSLFKVKNSSKEPSFDDFYSENEDGETIPDSMAIKQFIINVMGERTPEQFIATDAASELEGETRTE